MAISGAVALTGAGAAGALAAPGDPVFKLPYSDVLYQLTGTGETAALEALTYEQWESQGFPPYQVPPTDYLKVSWSPVLYALTDWPEDVLDDNPVPMTYEEWAATGFAAAAVEDGYLLGYLRFSTSSELFAVTPVSEFRKLSFAEWDAAGFPAPESLDAGFGKLTWSPEIGLFTVYETSAAEVLTLETWEGFDYPTPMEQRRFTGDRFYYTTFTSPEISYEGPTYNGPVTYEQWDAAGFPEPEPADDTPPPVVP